ncbi:hypothetical protein [Aquibium sp. ELW1220]|uniref:hypothetical protein n=1 Tax=Aquibium sp. ELW1220 TaxID=2976766 RepID=UPI0025B1D41B|nr:hypothetical protein [Aquibium sp. ELW1220]MDN2581930.1 hypothetical protein [Aquibium sp. ELW1220]
MNLACSENMNDIFCLLFFAPVVSAFVFMANFVVAIFAFTIARKALITNQISHLYAKTMDHNKLIFDNEYRMVVIDLFHGLEDEELKKKRDMLERKDEGHFNLYWATRSVHLSHLFLCAQVWIMCGASERKIAKSFPGWVIFTEKIAKELDNKRIERSNRPDWYKKACRQINLDDNESIYGKKFNRDLVKLQER